MAREPQSTRLQPTQSCLATPDPVDCSPPGSSVHGILQARVLEWVAIPFSRINSLHVSKSSIFMKNKYIFQNNKKIQRNGLVLNFSLVLSLERYSKQLITVFVSEEPEFGN